MFAFVDESGHTGHQLDDSNQRAFYSLGLIARTNADFVARKAVRSIQNRLGVSELHGAELGPRTEEIAGEIEKVLRQLNARFFLCDVSKDYLALTKFFDTLFDPFENKGVRNHTYNIRPLRMLLMYNISLLAPKAFFFRFYQECLFAKSQEAANDVLRESCEVLLSALDNKLDERSRELIGDALRWALKHPEELTTFNTTRQERWRHLPNVVSFVPMLNMFAQIAKDRGTAVRQIVHDEQLQFKRIFEEIHVVATNDRMPPSLDLGDNGLLLFESIKESTFKMDSSGSSPGLQLVDVCLYALTHAPYIDRQSDVSTASLIQFVVDRGEFFDFTWSGFVRECQRTMDWIRNLDLSPEDLSRGKDTLESAETSWRRRLNDSSSPAT